jgi:hypothetical protein
VHSLSLPIHKNPFSGCPAEFNLIGQKEKERKREKRERKREERKRQERDKKE